MHTRTDDSITAQYLDRYRRAAEAAGEPDGLLPVTGAQRRFVVARYLDAGRRPDLVPLFFAFPRGSVDPERLREAAGHLAAAHPALRTRAQVVRGVPVQRLTAPEAYVSRVAARPGEGAADALRRALAAWPGDGPPLRLLLTDAGAAETDGGTDGEGPMEILALALDHAVCDEQSLGQLSADLADAYRHRLGPQDVPAARAEADAAAYAEAVALQLEAERRASAPEALAYWTRRLDLGHATGRAAFVPDTVRPAGAVRARLALPAGHARAVAFPALLDACGTAARALTGGAGAGDGGEEHVPLLGYPWGGRPAKAAPVLGCFLNTVVHPAVPRRDASPAAADEAATTWWDDLDHADAPYDEVVRAARAAGVPWTGSLDGLLTFEDLHRRPPLRLGEAEGREIHIDGRPLQAPFTVAVSYGTDLLVRMAWDRGALPDARAEAAFDLLITALHAHLRPHAG
ncbi:non-ribosomal peptide synthetase [Streptomyces sp. NPDC048172]|uniref:non-ribosomal peptide synthetase n=1 Tax=Streptomyces sp. NPDC048172 TaxID=3365505 RepID=UPI0037154C2A